MLSQEKLFEDASKVILHYGLGFSAGILSLLAPCVLPLTPIIFGSSLKSSKLGPLASALGLTLSFTIFGVLTSLFSSLFDVTFIQKTGAVILVCIGVVFIFPKLKAGLTRSLDQIGRKGHEYQAKIKGEGLVSEFLLGVVLGMVWAPCSGPTLGMAFGLATQAEHALHATLIFFFFGLGAGLGLLCLGLLLRKFGRVTGIILRYEVLINRSVGIVSIIIGFIILFERMGHLEEWALSVLPQWLIELATFI